MDLSLVLDSLQRSAVMFRIFIGITLIQLQTNIDVSCYTIPWTCFPEIGSCYYLSEFETTQIGASCWCGGGNGQLLKIETSAELEKIRELIKAADKPTGYYIGATDRRTESDYVWEDGTSENGMIPWHDWGYASEPDNFGYYEHCAVLAKDTWWESSPRTFLNYDALDVGCEMDINFICESQHDPGIVTEKAWKQVSKGLHFTSEVIATVQSRSAIRCGVLCSQNCRCLSMAYQEQDSTCLQYGNYFSRLTSVTSPGYLNFEEQILK